MADRRQHDADGEIGSVIWWRALTGSTRILPLLSAIGIAGMDRLVRFNVWRCRAARSRRRRRRYPLLDKTGTITLGNRQATAFRPSAAAPSRNLLDAAQLASLADETPEGRSIVVLDEREVRHPQPRHGGTCRHLHSVYAQTRMSGVDAGASSVRKGAVDASSTMSGAGRRSHVRLETP